MQIRQVAFLQHRRPIDAKIADILTRAQQAAQLCGIGIAFPIFYARAISDAVAHAGDTNDCGVSAKSGRQLKKQNANRRRNNIARPDRWMIFFMLFYGLVSPER